MQVIYFFSAVLFFSSIAHANPIIVENSKPGTPDWWLKNPARNNQIEGFASKTSINAGEKIDIFVKTTSAKTENTISQSACNLQSSTGLDRPMLPPTFSPDQAPVGTVDFFAYYDYNLIRWLEREG